MTIKQKLITTLSCLALVLSSYTASSIPISVTILKNQNKTIVLFGVAHALGNPMCFEILSDMIKQQHCLAKGDSTISIDVLLEASGYQLPERKGFEYLEFKLARAFAEKDVAPICFEQIDLRYGKLNAMRQGEHPPLPFCIAQEFVENTLSNFLIEFRLKEDLSNHAYTAYDTVVPEYHFDIFKKPIEKLWLNGCAMKRMFQIRGKGIDQRRPFNSVLSDLELQGCKHFFYTTAAEMHFAAKLLRSQRRVNTTFLFCGHAHALILSALFQKRKYQEVVHINRYMAASINSGNTPKGSFITWSEIRQIFYNVMQRCHACGKPKPEGQSWKGSRACCAAKADNREFNRCFGHRFCSRRCFDAADKTHTKYCPFYAAAKAKKRNMKKGI